MNDMYLDMYLLYHSFRNDIYSEPKMALLNDRRAYYSSKSVYHPFIIFITSFVRNDIHLSYLSYHSFKNENDAVAQSSEH